MENGGATRCRGDARRDETATHMENTMRQTLIIVALAGMALLAAAPSVAHHAFGAEFDPNRPVQLKGPIRRIEWTNPHAWFHVEHIEADGSKAVWMVEAGTPNTLLRRGINRNSVPPGTVVIIDGYQSKDGMKRANGRRMTLADGETLFMGSSGTGAPRDGADPTEGDGADPTEGDGADPTEE